MTYLLISDEQARLIADATSPVVFVDRSGREVAKVRPLTDEEKALPPLSEEELAELKRRKSMPGPGKTTQEVLARLQAQAPIQAQ